MEIVTSTVSSIIVEVGKSLLAPIGRQVGYLIYYNRNVNNLRMELRKLVGKKTTELMPRVEAAQKNSEIIFSSVIKWLKEVDDIVSTATEFLEIEYKRIDTKCLNGLCPNPKSRYYLGRKAMKITENVLALLQEAGTFTNQIANPVPLPMENEVWEALKDNNLGMIGICGMGGVGKTTLVKKLAKRVENEKIFDETVMTVISQEPDFIKIQDEIAEQLGLKFDHQSTLPIRAARLRERIMKSGKRILIILDDIWKELDFEAIGLPSTDAKGGCITIVLTSRREDVCNKMRSQKNFRIQVLTNDETWSLFREMVGDSIDQNVHQTAREVSDECRGLPIAVITLAKALKNKPQEVWKDALLLLKNPDQESSPDMQEHVYSRVELSYNLIGRKEAQSCLLLCCLYPEDYDVPIEDLVRYGMGLRLFANVRGMQQVRNRVHSLIHELKDSFLLLEGNSKKYDSVKMHGIVRDVAIRIASNDEHRYMVSSDAKMEVWPYEERERYRDCAAISIVRREVKQHPADLECPKLQLLRLQYDYDSQSLPNNFFNGMKELKVLSLEIPSLRQPLDVLKKLRTLRLQNLQSEDISAIGALISLEILQIGTGTRSELPNEIGELKNLKLLDLRKMRLRHIPAGVLSRLSKLEELYVNIYFKSWGFDENGKTNTILNEIESYTMTALRIGVSSPSVLPKQFAYVNLERFHILIGEEPWTGPVDKDNVNELNLGGDASVIKDSGVCVLLKKVKALSLNLVSNLKSVVYELQVEGIPNLETLSISGCEQLEYFVDGSKQIPLQLPYFNNLREISISACDKLKYVFPISIARGLKQLEDIFIRFCDEMEGVFYRKLEEEDEQIIARDDKVEYPNKLKALRLCWLPELISLWVDVDNAADQLKVKERTQLQSHSLFPAHWIQLQNLQILHLAVCRLIKVAFPLSIAQQLVQLTELRIGSCAQLQYIVAEEEEEEGDHEKKETTKIEFPMLRSLYCIELPELVAFCPSSYISFNFPKLEDLQLRECPKMKSFTICRW